MWPREIIGRHLRNLYDFRKPGNTELEPGRSHRQEEKDNDELYDRGTNPDSEAPVGGIVYGRMGGIEGDHGPA